MFKFSDESDILLMLPKPPKRRNYSAVGIDIQKVFDANF